MTQPETGADWSVGGFTDTDSRFAIRGPLVAVLARDYRGAATDISPHVFNPLAKDGKLRADLFARRKVGGYWVNNPEPNQGWLFLGANTKTGGPSVSRTLMSARWRSCSRITRSRRTSPRSKRR
ncbi:putative gp11 [Mycobacteroides abscessus subsp. bolletii 1513]|uniref:Putative gp11 n=1 Tax=Mycobacteroides abscessus subsp. bolletii 1513 TaxID=1299321 RepID=X8DH80_9MYCO|nr:putative gp11 [Mycobacteroides abscessus subsp. bolletii 1513]